MPVDAHSRPLLDDHRPGGFGCLLDRSLIAIDRAASDGMSCSSLPTHRLETMDDVAFPEPGMYRLQLHGNGELLMERFNET